MKDLLIVIIIIAVLGAVFSIYGPFFPSWSAGGLTPRYPGEQGVVLPGDGDSIAEMTPVISEYEMYEQADTNMGKAEPGMSEVKNEVTENVESELTREKEQGTNMNEIVIAFWHGVAAVLIGGASTLVLAGAFRKYVMKE